jgi:hypothetical protein
MGSSTSASDRRLACKILHFALVEIRAISATLRDVHEDVKGIFDLAEMLHEIPLDLMNEAELDLPGLQARLRKHAQRFGGRVDYDQFVFDSQTPLPQPTSVARSREDERAASNVGGVYIDDDVLASIPATLVREHTIVPIGMRGGVLVVAMSKPDDYDLIQKLEFMLGRPIAPAHWELDDIRRKIDQHYP